MIIWSSDSIKLVCVFKAFTSRDFQTILVERLKMTHVMQIRIPLKCALTKMLVGLVQKWSKNFYKNAVGEPKVCEIRTHKSSIRQYFSVCWPLLKMRGRDPYL